MNLIQIVIEIIFGTLTGYVTNDFAIKELFKKGGIVERTRDEFTLEISALLEQRVLTESVLQEKLEAPEVQEAIKLLLGNFLSRDLPEQLGNLRLEDFVDSDKLVQGLQEVAVNLWQEEKEDFKKHLENGLADSEILSPKQREKIIEVAFALILAELQEGEYFAQSLKNWSVAHQGQTWSQSEWGELITQVSESIGKKLAQGKNSWLEQEKQELTDEIHHILARTNFVEALTSFIADCSEKTITDYYPEAAHEIKQQLLGYFHSEKGEAVLEIVSEKLLLALSEVELTLAELLPTEQIQEANPFLREQIEQLLQVILVWLADNKYNLSKLVEDAVNEVFSAYDGMQGVVLHYVKENFITEFIYNYDFTGQLQKQTEEQQTTQEILQYLEEYLLHQPLGEVLQQILPAKRGQELILPMLKENVDFYLQNYAEKHLEQFFNYPLAHWLGDYFNQTKIEEIISSLESQTVNYLDKLDLEQVSLKLSEKMLTQEISVTLSEKTIEGVQKLLLENLTVLKKYCTQQMSQLNNEKLIEKLFQQISNYLSKQDNIFSEIQQKPLQPIYQQLLSEEVADKLVAKGQMILLEHFVPMSRGSLSMLAKEKLDLLTNEEMRLLVQEFMGSKLKTLSYLGAGMGSIVGLATGVGLSQVSGPYLFGKTFIFGALGYGTNCAAIKGLFWPYQPVGGKDWLQGIIPRQKKSFAHFMGQMVNDYVVNEEIFQQIVHDYRSKATTQIITLTDNPAFCSTLQQKANLNLAQSYPSAEGIMTQKLLTACSAWGQKPLQNILSRPTVQGAGVRYYPILSQKVYMKSVELVHSDKLFPVQELCDYTEAKLFKAEVPNIQGFWQHFWTKNYSVGDFCSQNSLEQLFTKGEELCLQKLLAPESCQQIAERCNNFLRTETLGTAFQGQLTVWLEHNLQKMLAYFLQKIVILLQTKQENLTMLIQENIINSLTLFQQLGYSMINGNKLVGEVVEKIITEKLPVFLDLKQQEIGSVVMSYWHNNLAHISLRDFQLAVEPQTLQVLFTNVVEQKALQEGKEELLVIFKGTIPNLPLSPLAKQLQIEEEIAIVQAWLENIWQEEKDEVSLWLKSHCQPYLLEVFGTMRLQDIFLPWADNWLTATWFNSQLEQLKLEQLAQRFYQNLLTKIGAKSAEDIVDWLKVVEQISLLLNYFLTDKEARLWLANTLQRVLASIYEKLPPNMKQQIIELLVNAVFSSLEHDGAAILKEMNLAALTEEQVLAMEPQELEEMVWRFGRQYLVHIQNMGWLGAVFALPGILLTLLI